MDTMVTHFFAHYQTATKCNRSLQCLCTPDCLHATVRERGKCQLVLHIWATLSVAMAAAFSMQGEGSRNQDVKWLYSVLTLNH